MLRTLAVTVDFGCDFFLYGFFRDDVLKVGTFSKYCVEIDVSVELNKESKDLLHERDDLEL